MRQPTAQEQRTSRSSVGVRRPRPTVGALGARAYVAFATVTALNVSFILVEALGR